MTTTPFRKTSSADTQIEPVRVSAVARFFAWILPVSLFGSCRWYRRATGGRWTRMWVARDGAWEYEGWSITPFCWHSASPKDHRRGECTKELCKCEEYDEVP